MENIIEINGERYIREASKGEAKLKIIVCDRGWVAVGKTVKDGDYYYVSDAKIIRRWGTTKGLGELAELGPQNETKLDPCPNLEIHTLTTVLLMDCNEDNWK